MPVAGTPTCARALDKQGDRFQLLATHVVIHASFDSTQVESTWQQSHPHVMARPHNSNSYIHPQRTHNVKHAHLGARNRVHDRLHHLVSKHRMAWAAASDSWYDMQQHHHPTPHPIPSTTTQHHRQQQPARWCPAASIRAWGMKSSYLRCSRTPGA